MMKRKNWDLMKFLQDSALIKTLIIKMEAIMNLSFTKLTVTLSGRSNFMVVPLNVLMMEYSQSTVIMTLARRQIS